MDNHRHRLRDRQRQRARTETAGAVMASTQTPFADRHRTIIAQPMRPGKEDARHSKRSRMTVGLVALAAVMAAGCSSSTNSTAAHESSSQPCRRRLPPSAPALAAPAAAARSRGPPLVRALGEGRPRVDARYVEPRHPPPSRANNRPRASRHPRRLPQRCPWSTRRVTATRSPPSRQAPTRGSNLTDWSGDGSHALFSRQ